MRLRLVREPFDHPDYIFELKHDGFRAVVYLQARECKIISLNQRNLGFEARKRSLAKLVSSRRLTTRTAVPLVAWRSKARNVIPGAESLS
jgi:hypothetical protein